jgi:hypothetical protein
VTAALVSGAVDAGVLDETVFSSMIASRKIDKSKVRVSIDPSPLLTMYS